MLTSEKSKWDLTDECDDAFHTLKEILVSALIPGYPDPKAEQFILETDQVITLLDVFYLKFRKTVRE